MDLKKITAIIGLVSVVVMFLWGMLGNDWAHSWIAVFVGGVVCALLRILSKDSK